MSAHGIATCPYCRRTVKTCGNRFGLHAVTPGRKPSDDRDTCPLSRQHTLIEGDHPNDYIARAHVVADLAEQVQDRDTALVWTYLTCLPADELQRLTMIALAAVPTEGQATDIWAWVTELPAAKQVSA